MNIDFILGERKYIIFDIRSMIQQIIVITSATYTLTDNEGNIVDEGNCEIEGNVLQLLLEPESKGDFILDITYEIPPEIRKGRCEVHVY